MRIKLEKRTLEDGRVRKVVMYRPHWWSSWRPLLDKDGEFVINWGHLSDKEEEIIRKMRCLADIIPKERMEAHLSMIDMVLDDASVYVGYHSFDGGYAVAYDAPYSNITVEDLQNLEIKEE